MFREMKWPLQAQLEGGLRPYIQAHCKDCAFTFHRLRKSVASWKSWRVGGVKENSSSGDFKADV